MPGSMPSTNMRLEGSGRWWPKGGWLTPSVHCDLPGGWCRASERLHRPATAKGVGMGSSTRKAVWRAFAAAACVMGVVAVQAGPALAVSTEGFAQARFSHPARITNTFLPLIPGSQLVLEGKANGGGSLLPHRVVFTVSDVTKVVNGVRTLAVWERDFTNGKLVEEEIAFFAQDDTRRVCNLRDY